MNKSESFLRNFSALNYLNISEEYVGTITLINHKNKIVSLNKFKKDKFDNIYDEKTARKEAVVSCWEIVELFDDGSVRHTGIIYCYQGGGGNIDDGSETPTYPHGGGGGEPSEETFDDQIDTANLDSCSKAILEAIQNGNSIEDIINQFAGEDSQFSWSLVTNDGSNFENSENLAETNWNNATANSYITEIKSSYSSSATRLSIARTIVHEAIHAYILSYIDIAAQGNSSASYSEFPDLWNQLVAKKYGDPNTTSGWNQYHHEEMARNYVTTIANALAIWDNNQNSSQYYTDLAWGGLFETEIFNQTSDLTAEDRERIAESNRSEDLNNSNAQGNPCN